MNTAYDFVFVIDNSESMSGCWSVIKTKIIEFLNAQADNGWRARVVVYNASVNAENPFVKSITGITAQLEKVEISKEEQSPRVLLDALYRISTWGQTEKGTPCCEDKWRYRSEAKRCVTVFTDGEFVMRTTASDEPHLQWEDVANLVMQERLSMLLYAPQMECYDSLSQIDHCEYCAIPFETETAKGYSSVLRECVEACDGSQLLPMASRRSASVATQKVKVPESITIRGESGEITFAEDFSLDESTFRKLTSYGAMNTCSPSPLFNVKRIVRHVGLCSIDGYCLHVNRGSDIKLNGKKIRDDAVLNDGDVIHVVQGGVDGPVLSVICNGDKYMCMPSVDTL